MEAIDMEAARERFAKSLDELLGNEIVVIQKPQEPELEPCGWVEMHGEVEDLFPPGWWRWPMTERRAKWLAENLEGFVKWREGI